MTAAIIEHAVTVGEHLIAPLHPIVMVILLWLFFGGGTPKPWSAPGTGTRRSHRAAYGKKGFRI